MREMKPGLSARASASISPTSAWMPASVSMDMPPPATSGLGSLIAATTRATPAWISASAHGGVRPWCEQGSSVTYTVAPRAASPAAFSAWTSACGVPAR